MLCPAWPRLACPARPRLDALAPLSPPPEQLPLHLQELDQAGSSARVRIICVWVDAPGLSEEDVHGVDRLLVRPEREPLLLLHGEDLIAEAAPEPAAVGRGAAQGDGGHQGVPGRLQDRGGLQGEVGFKVCHGFCPFPWPAAQGQRPPACRPAWAGWRSRTRLSSGSPP